MENVKEKTQRFIEETDYKNKKWWNIEEIIINVVATAIDEIEEGSYTREEFYNVLTDELENHVIWDDDIKKIFLDNIDVYNELFVSAKLKHDNLKKQGVNADFTDFVYWGLLKVLSKKTMKTISELSFYEKTKIDNNFKNDLLNEVNKCIF